MAFTQPNVATNNIATLNAEPNDLGGLTATQLQALFDKFGVDWQTWFKNTHLAELSSIVAGSSASEYLGSAPIAGITGNTIYAQLVSLLAVAQAAQAGAILPGTITDIMLSNLAGQIKDTMTKHLADEVDHVSYAVDSGVANAYAVTLSPAPTAYVDGMGVSVKVGNASTGASTLNVNALGAKPILDTLGNALTATNNLKSGLIYSFRYNATTGNFILQGKGGGGNATAAHLLLGDTATVDAGQITGTMPSKLAENLGTLGATLLNLVTNGSFESGLTGWTTVAGAPAVTSLYSKFGTQSYYVNTTASTLSDFIFTAPGANHKIYISEWVNCTAYPSSGFINEFHSNAGATIGSISVPGLTSGWQRFSGIFTNTATDCSFRIGAWAASPPATPWVAEWDGIVIIDLTAVFGAGLEPTQAQMDAIMTALGGFFDGNAILSKIASGGYINNGVLGTPEVLLNDPNHIAANIPTAKIIYGVTGTAIVIASFTAGDSIVYDDLASVTTASSTPVKIYELKMLVSGSIRFKFNLKSTTGGVIAYAQIYKNGVAVGTLRTNSTTADTTFSEDMSFGINDLIQIYGYSSNTSYAASVSNIILGNSVVIPAVTRTL